MDKSTSKKPPATKPQDTESQRSASDSTKSSEPETLPKDIKQALDSKPVPEKSKSRFHLGALLFFLIILLLVGISFAFTFFQQETSKESVPGPTVSRIVNASKIIIGTDATFPPMEFGDDKGNLLGYDIDLGDRISEELNVEAEFVNIAWDDVFEALLQGEVDVIISSVTITDERKQKYDFSDPYLNAGQVIITRKENTSISSTDDLQGKKIAVQKGTTNEQQAYQYTSKAMVLTYDDFIDATNALLNGEADVIFSDLTGAKGIVNKSPTLKIASDPFTSEFYGIVFRKGEEDLVAKINSVLEILRQRGVLVLLKQKWLE